MRTPSQAAFLVHESKRALANHLVNSTDSAVDVAKEKQLRQTLIDLNSELETAKFAQRFIDAMNASAADHARQQAEASRSITIDSKKLDAAYRAFMGSGRVLPELRDLFTTNGSGALVPQLIAPTLYQKRRNFARVLEVIDGNEVNSGAPQKVVTVDDSGNSFVLIGSEGGSLTAADPSLTSTLNEFDTIGTKTQYSRQIASDSNWSVDRIFTTLFGVRYWRALERATTLGVDANNTVLPNQISGGLVGAASVGQTTSALSNGIGLTDLVSLVGSVDYTYANQGVASFMFSTGIRTYLLGLKDGQGRQYFNELNEGTLLGYDVVINDSMVQSIAVNGLPILFGSMKDFAFAAYTPLSVKSIFESVASGVDLAATLQAEALGFSRLTSTVKIQSAVKSLKLAAS